MPSDKVTAGLVVLQSSDNFLPGFSAIRELFDGDVLALINSLSKTFLVSKVWKIVNETDIEVYSGELAESKTDVLFFIFQSNDMAGVVPALLDASGKLPIVVWSYLPWRRIPRPIPYLELCRAIGASATIESFGLMLDQKRPVLHAFGSHDDPALRDKFKSIGEAARVVRELQTTRFGVVLAEEYEDALSDFGTTTIHFSCEDLLKETGAIIKEDVDLYIGEVQSRAVVGNVSKTAIEESALFSLGMQRMADNNGLNLVGIEENPGRLIKAGIRARPSLFVESLTANQTLFQPSQDMDAGLANFILAKLSKESPIFVSIWVWDQARNTVICGHPGAQPISVAQVETLSIESDLEWDCYSTGNSAQMQFVARPGRITLLQMRKSPDGWQAIAATGMCLESDRVVMGMPHSIIRLDCHIDRFLGDLARIGSNNHWIMAYASVVPELQYLCEMLGIRLEVLR